MLLADLSSPASLTMLAAHGKALSRPALVVGLSIVVVSVIVPMPAVV